MARDYPLRVLFICSRNRRRSLTAEMIFGGEAGLEVRSAGTQPQARVLVTEGLLGWAEIIFVMERSHLNRLRLRYAEALDRKRVIILHIPDDYEYMQEELVDELQTKVGEHL